MLEMCDRFPPTCEEQVAAFEKDLRHGLPAKYREFLIFYNGGRLQKDVFTIRGDGEDLANFFYGILGDGCYDLAGNRSSFASRIPDDMLPIADDPGGNQICISLSLIDPGSIHLWNHELEFTPDGAITRLSDSFDEFIASLREDAEV